MHKKLLKSFNISGKIREGEVKQLRMFQYLEGSQFFAWNCAPFLVALSSFATYTTVAGGILDSQTAFVSLTLFNTLRGPLFLLPFGIAAIIQGNVALKRINTFLNAEELDLDSVRNDTFYLCFIWQFSRTFISQLKLH